MPDYQLNKWRKRLVGIPPGLLMHNPTFLANPLSKESKAIKEISQKRKKTDADHLRMMELEFYAGFYLENGIPVIPSGVILGTAFVAGKKFSLGPKVKAGFFCEGSFPLEYEGSKNPIDLWNLGDGFHRIDQVIINRSRILRCRPFFQEWSAVIEAEYDPSLLNPNQVDEIFELGGRIVGLMDWRPRFGRFEVVDE